MEKKWYETAWDYVVGASIIGGDTWRAVVEKYPRVTLALQGFTAVAIYKTVRLFV